MRHQIQIVSSRGNFEKAKGLFLNKKIEFIHLQCDCKEINFLKNGHDMAIFYPEKVNPKCVECVKKARSNSGLFFLSNALNIQEMIEFICAGAEDCFTKETFYLVERASRDLLNKFFDEEAK